MDELFGPMSSDWLNLYHPDGYRTIGEDITALISPDMTREIVLPALRAALRGVGNVVFHWHTGAMATLDAVLRLEEMTVLQWSSDINHIRNPPVNHLDQIARIFDAGKKLFLYIEPEHIPVFAKAFPATGVAFGFNAASEAHGLDIIRALERAYRN